MVTATFYTFGTHKYIGIFSGKDWMEARRKASEKSGVPVDDLIPWGYTSNTFRVKEMDETPYAPRD